MYGKLQVTGIIEIVTGLHIGGSTQFSAIGAVDSPVIRDAISGEPMIPGSSLKGKIRTLLSRQYANGIARTPDDDPAEIIRIFGGSKKVGDRIPQGRFLFSDMVMSNWDELSRRGAMSRTEIKFENNINRYTAVANPRQIERVIRGARFDVDIIYELVDESQAEEDFALFAEGLRMLEYDYLGGHGSRGYGKVRFEDMDVSAVVGDIEPEVVEKCKKALAVVG